MDWLTGSKQGEAKKLITQLEDPSKRDAAARALISLGNDAVPPLINALQSRDLNLIHLYQQILIRIPAAIPALSAALSTAPKEVRIRCAEALGLSKDKAVVPVLTQALRSEFYLVRVAAAAALGNVGDTGAIPALFEAMKDPEEEVRAAACAAVCKFKDPSTFDEVTNVILEDSSIEVRQAAVRGLGETRHPSAIPFLLEALRDPFWWYERGQAVQDLLAAIEKMGAPAVGPLIEALADKEMTVRKFAALLLGRMKDPGAIEELGMALYDLHPEVSLNAAEALAAFGSQAVDLLAAALNHPEATIREHAVWALGKTADPRAIPLLLQMLQDPERGVVIKSMQGLAAMRAAEARPALQQIAANRSDRELAAAAKEALGSIL